MLGARDATGVFDTLMSRVAADRRDYAAAPIERHIMVVVKERTKTWQPSRPASNWPEPSPVTWQLLTLQARDGTRTEYSTSDAVAAKVAAGDIGVAFTKRDTLVDFVRFDV